MNAFDIIKKFLPDTIKEIMKGKIQLPDFRRGRVWGDECVRSLLISISRSFSIGAAMLFETGGCKFLKLKSKCLTPAIKYGIIANEVTPIHAPHFRQESEMRASKIHSRPIILKLVILACCNFCDYHG